MQGEIGGEGARVSWGGGNDGWQSLANNVLPVPGGPKTIVFITLSHMFYFYDKAHITIVNYNYLNDTLSKIFLFQGL